jgi:predicted nucleic acid-binding protein
VQTSAEAIYLDSSALVKLVIDEPESPALQRYLAAHRVRISSALARVEVVRAVRPYGGDVVLRARNILRRLRLLELGNDLLHAAGDIDPPTLRTLDAIHLAAAHTLRREIGELVTYDTRLARAASARGFTVVAPS